LGKIGTKNSQKFCPGVEAEIISKYQAGRQEILGF